uniref:Uncharacterized protein n=1 Tax=Arundo donax TaxID=35708 RepID=A0A0A9CFN6_ARUDO
MRGEVGDGGGGGQDF